MMKKMIVALMIMVTTAASAATVSAASTELNVVTYESCDLTTEILCTRAERHEIIIEKIVGVCLDDEGNGQILNAWDDDYDYISYASAPDIREGDVVMTLLTYNPDTNWDDDVIERCDFVIDAGVEIGEEE